MTVEELSDSSDSGLLASIEWRANCIANDAERLISRRSFYTLAEDQLNRAERVLTEALERVRATRTTYENKPAESRHAA